MSGPYTGRLVGWSRVTAFCTAGTLFFLLDCPALNWARVVGGALVLATMFAATRASYWLGRAVEYDNPHARGDVTWSIFSNDAW